MLESSRTFPLGKLEASVCRGDIASLAVDAVVNAANAALSGGSGVDGALHRGAGPELLEACALLGRCPTGSAVITPGFDLPAKYVIHAVGPIWENGSAGEAELLASCYRESLALADRHELQSLALPALSTGAYRFPKPAAAQIALHTCRDFEPTPGGLKRLFFVLFDEASERVYQRELRNL